MNELKEQGSKAYLISIVMVCCSDMTQLSYLVRKKVFRPSLRLHRILITPTDGMVSLRQVLSSAVLSDLLFPDSWPRTWDERNR